MRRTSRKLSEITFPQSLLALFEFQLRTMQDHAERIEHEQQSMSSVLMVLPTVNSPYTNRFDLLSVNEVDVRRGGSLILGLTCDCLVSISGLCRCSGKAPRGEDRSYCKSQQNHVESASLPKAKVSIESYLFQLYPV